MMTVKISIGPPPETLDEEVREWLEELVREVYATSLSANDLDVLYDLPDKASDGMLRYVINGPTGQGLYLRDAGAWVKK